VCARVRIGRDSHPVMLHVARGEIHRERSRSRASGHRTGWGRKTPHRRPGSRSAQARRQSMSAHTSYLVVPAACVVPRRADSTTRFGASRSSSQRTTSRTIFLLGLSAAPRAASAGRAREECRKVRRSSVMGPTPADETGRGGGDTASLTVGVVVSSVRANLGRRAQVPPTVPVRDDRPCAKK